MLFSAAFVSTLFLASGALALAPEHRRFQDQQSNGIQYSQVTAAAVLTGENLNYIETTFVVPEVSASGVPGSASAIVGISLGGFGCSNILLAGVQFELNSDLTISYQAVYMESSGIYNLGVPVSPGDTVQFILTVNSDQTSGMVEYLSHSTRDFKNGFREVFPNFSTSVCLNNAAWLIVNTSPDWGIIPKYGTVNLGGQAVSNGVGYTPQAASTVYFMQDSDNKPETFTFVFDDVVTLKYMLE